MLIFLTFSYSFSPSIFWSCVHLFEHIIYTNNFHTIFLFVLHNNLMRQIYLFSLCEGKEESVSYSTHNTFDTKYMGIFLHQPVLQFYRHQLDVL